MRRSARLIGYVRPSPSDPEFDTAIQVAALKQAAADNHWRLLPTIAEESIEAGSRSDRPAVEQALRAVEHGEAHGLVATSFFRLAVSLRDLVGLVDRAQSAGGTVVALDRSFMGADERARVGRIPTDDFFDSSEKPYAALMQVWGMAVTFERAATSIRTRDAMAARRSAGHGLGRPTVADNEQLSGEICSWRDEGHEYQQIAQNLNDRGEPTVRGGKEWRPSSIETVLRQHREDRQRASRSPAADA